MKELATTHLILEPIGPEHAALTFDLWQDPRLYDFIPNQPPKSLVDLEAKYLRFSLGMTKDGTRKVRDWMSKDKLTGDYVGYLESTIDADGTATIAYSTFTQFWGRGYAREGMSEVISHLISHEGVCRLVAEIDTRNIASQMVAESLGLIRQEDEVEAKDANGVTYCGYRYTLKIG